METNTEGQHLKIIPPTLHSVIDYILIAVLLISPSILELAGLFAYGAYGLAVVYLLLTLTTRYAGGMFSGMSFRAHGVFELLLALGMIVSPWVFQFADQADPRNFFFVLGIVVFALGFFTRYQPVERDSSEDTVESESDPKQREGDDDKSNE